MIIPDVDGELVDDLERIETEAWSDVHLACPDLTESLGTVTARRVGPGTACMASRVDVLAFNRAAIEDKLTRLAAWLELPNPSYTAVMDWVLALRGELGIAHTLKDIGVDDARADELSEMAAKDPTAPTNPVPIGAAELKGMFIDALEGRLN